MTDDDHLERINALTCNVRQSWFALLAALVFVGIRLIGVKYTDFCCVGGATTLRLVSVERPTRLFFIAIIAYASPERVSSKFARLRR